MNIKYYIKISQLIKEANMALKCGLPYTTVKKIFDEEINKIMESTLIKQEHVK